MAHFTNFCEPEKTLSELRSDLVSCRVRREVRRLAFRLLDYDISVQSTQSVSAPQVTQFVLVTLSFIYLGKYHSVLLVSALLICYLVAVFG